MSLPEIGLRVVAAAGLMVSIGCGASPRSSVSGVETFSPRQSSEPLSRSVSMKKCGPFDDILIPVVGAPDTAPVIPGPEYIPEIGDIRQCRAGDQDANVVVTRAQVQPGRTAQGVAAELLRLSGTKQADISPGSRAFVVEFIDPMTGKRVRQMVVIGTDNTVVHGVRVTGNGNVSDRLWTLAQTQTLPPQ